MTAKEYLMQVKRLDEIINAKLDEVHTLRGLATKVTSTPSTDKVQMTTSHDKTGDIIAKIVDLERFINSTIDKLVDLKIEVMQTIEELEDSDYRLLLWLRYINFKTWEQIAVEMGYTYQWVCGGLHSRALTSLEIILKEKMAS